jgi:hypothetical protein
LAFSLSLSIIRKRKEENQFLKKILFKKKDNTFAENNEFAENLIELINKRKTSETSMDHFALILRMN